MTRTAFILGFVFAAAGCSSPETPAGSAGACTATKGKAACELEGEPINDAAPTTLADARGKIVIVDFWATWCEPCKKSFPQYQQIMDKYAGDVVVIGVSVDEEDVPKAELEEFAKTNGNVTFPIVWDKSKVTSRQYKPETMPTSYVIDREGILRHVHVGFKGGEVEEIEAEIEALLE